jgi:hypothetical protein
MIAGKSKKLAAAKELRELTPAELTEVSGGWEPCGFNWDHHRRRHHHHKHHHHRHHRQFLGCGPDGPIL